MQVQSVPQTIHLNRMDTQDLNEHTMGIAQLASSVVIVSFEVGGSSRQSHHSHTQNVDAKMQAAILSHIDKAVLPVFSVNRNRSFLKL